MREVGVVSGPGKTAAQIEAMVGALLRECAGPVFVTRATAEQRDAVCKVWPQALHHQRSGLSVARPFQGPLRGQLAVVTAGTSDLAAAEEGAAAARALGVAVTGIADVGVAGLHRLIAHRGLLEQVDCVIVAAGMDGALASVTAGLVSCPVIALPTSIGYGTSLQGVAALLSMISSCTPGVAVVNVDDGVGAALVACRTIRSYRSRRSSCMS
ncbi:MAG TPA: nickel pincer cofactor biosynthesis protein LarB [Actinomycetes bacterium]|jgi:NCAIR mutase (PurE)-related protein|nr:nickel pincer cofactor biosynthesis protein LarB [Actinomycetes bacterium]